MLLTRRGMGDTTVLIPYGYTTAEQTGSGEGGPEGSALPGGVNIPLTQAGEQYPATTSTTPAWLLPVGIGLLGLLLIKAFTR